LPAALQHNPDVIFIEFAINDSSTDLNIPLETSKANLQTMIDTIRDWAADKNKSVDIVIQTMNNEPWSGVRPNLPDYYQGYREVAAANGLLLIDNYPNWLNLYNKEANHPTWKSYMDAIGVHPNALGVEKVILPEIQRALNSQVPEPPSLVLLGTGLIALTAGLLAYLWKRRK
jgi:lysophospholipase L1-like esterase